MAKENRVLSEEDLIKLIPRAIVWAQDQEQQILQNGVPLSNTQLEDARIISLKCPEKVRLLNVNQIPLPEDPELKLAAQAIGLITPNTIGLTLQYGIFIRTDHWNDRGTVRHELVHTSQYERLGGVQQFLNQYLIECMQFGYPNGPLEQEAITRGKSILT